MAKLGIFCTIASLLLMVQLSQADIVKDIAELGAQFQTVGRTIECLADLGEDPAILGKVNKIADGAVAAIKQGSPQLKTAELMLDFVKSLVSNAATHLKPIDEKCSSVSAPFTAHHTPAEAVDLGKLGIVFEKIGTTLTSLTKNPDSEILSKIPELFKKSIEGIANENDAKKTSVGVLLKHKSIMAENLKKLCSDCA